MWVSRILYVIGAWAVVSLFAATTAICAEVDQQAIARANAHYNVGNYKIAAREYRKLASADSSDSTILYNLANALHRLGHSGDAIATMLVAQHLAPGDEDIKHNLSVMREAVGNKFYYEPVDNWRKLLALNNCVSPTNIVLLFLVSFIGMWAILPFIQQTAHWALFTFCTITALTTGSALYLTSTDIEGQKYISLLSDEASRTPAVVVRDDTVVYAGNAKTFQKVKLLQPGQEVYVTSRRSGWLQIQFPDQRFGWVEENTMVLL